MYFSTSSLILMALSAAGAATATPTNTTANAQLTTASATAPLATVSVLYMIDDAVIVETPQQPAENNSFCDTKLQFSIICKGTNDGALGVRCAADTYFNRTSGPDSSRPKPLDCSDSPDVQAQWFPTTLELLHTSNLTISLNNQNPRVWQLPNITLAKSEPEFWMDNYGAFNLELIHTTVEI